MPAFAAYPATWWGKCARQRCFWALPQAGFIRRSSAVRAGASWAADLSTCTFRHLRKWGFRCPIRAWRLNARAVRTERTYFLRYPSVGATENIMLAACRGSGTVTVTNAAREPEIEDLQNFINAMGGNIRGAGSGIIIIEGVEKLHGVDYNIIGNRIEAATYLAAAIATDGEITVSGVCPSHLTAVTDLIVNSGGSVCRKHDSITASRGGQFILSPGKVETSPYPGFPTDAQSLIMAMLLCAAGTTEIHEGVFDDRLRVSYEFIKMGADITVSGRTAYVHGTERLYGARVFAGICARARRLSLRRCPHAASVIKNISHIERGYNNFETKLRGLGGNIIKLKD